VNNYASASKSFTSSNNNQKDNYGIQDININMRSRSLDSIPSSYDVQAVTNFQGNSDNGDKRKIYSSINTDNQNQSYKSYISSFSSSSYDPKRAPNILQRTFSDIQLKQLFRSSGCVNDEIKLVCISY
jgi:hypothetical protein